MITLEVHPEVHVREQLQRSEYGTCFECHRSFRATTEEQLNLGLCDHCVDVARHISEPVLSIHVKVLPRKPIVL